MSMYPSAPQSPEATQRPAYTSIVAVVGGLVLGAVLSMLIVPIFVSPALAAAWIYLVIRAYQRNDILTGVFKAPFHKEIAFRATGIAIANPLASLITLPLVFFVSEVAFRGFTFVIWAVLAISAERFALHLIKKNKI